MCLQVRSACVRLGVVSVARITKQARTVATSNEAPQPVSQNPALNQEQAQRLDSAAGGLTKEQLLWSSGYLAGLATASIVSTNVPVVSGAGEESSQQTLTILYGSQTGNGRELAESLLTRARNSGIDARCVDMADYSTRNLVKERWVALIVSTHGEGDAPDDAELLLEFLHSKRAPKLDSLNYFVLALGDSSYAQFCQTGRDFDQRLSELGANRVSGRVECDIDYEGFAEQWFEDTLRITQEQFKSSSDELSAPRVPLQVVENWPKYSKSHPFMAEVLVNQRITGSQSSKAVHHLELSLEGSLLNYEPGDSLGVITPNPACLVDEIIQLLGVESAAVKVGDESVELRKALTNHVELTLNSGVFLTQYSDLINNADLSRRVQDTGLRTELLNGYQVIDVLRQWPYLPEGDKSAGVQVFVDSLRPLAPRVYSISSSAAVSPDEVHITVAHVSYTAFGSNHLGAASTALVENLQEGELLPVYLDSNPRFRLPENSNTDVIMIGPGTGVAPFRAFVQQRTELGAQGRNWLFFGDRNFDEDFLYQSEWQQYLRREELRMDVAFSRDQKEKLYVQDRLVENADEIYAWIEAGATVYVCGDAGAMAADVHAALRSIVETRGNKTQESAENYLTTLKRNRRYLRDVY